MKNIPYYLFPKTKLRLNYNIVREKWETTAAFRQIKK